MSLDDADIRLLEEPQVKIAVAESSQVCYTHLASGVCSRNRLLCAFEGAFVVDTSAITT
jgi:hypothetical protein